MARGLGKGLNDLMKETGAAYEEAYRHHAFEFTEEERKNAEEMDLCKSQPAPQEL